jgi:TonB-linked SusC/RagA family outer membrane protein
VFHYNLIEMNKKYIYFLGILFCGLLTGNMKAQNEAPAKSNLTDSVSGKLTSAEKSVDENLLNTGASYTISGKELERMTTGNFLNTLNGRIPGLTVNTGSGEPGYDNPTFNIRGMSSWNAKSNNILVYLDGFEVSLDALVPLSASEVESVTVLKDAATMAFYGFSGDGILLVTTKKGKRGKTVISMNAHYGVQSAIQLPKVLDAYDYTRLYNKARQNDGLPIKYADPELYKSTNDPVHPNVDWYNEMINSASPIQNYNISFSGGSDKAKYFLLLDHANYSGVYKNADQIDKDYGTNALYKKYNIRGNIEIQLSKNLSINSEVSGKIEDRITPAGFSASDLFSKLLQLPSAAFSIKNPDGTWGTNATNQFNPVHLLQTAGVYTGHTRNLQTNFSFKEKLDMITKGLSLNGGISFSNKYMGNYTKSFTVPTYELKKDANDNPILDVNGNYTYQKYGTLASSISDGGVSFWKRSTFLAGLNYDRSFGLHSIRAIALAKRQNYSYNGLIYEFRTQGVSGEVTYDFSKKYIADITMAYMGSDNLGSAKCYGMFPAVGLGWVVSNEEFLKNSAIVNYLKLRSSYGMVGNLDDDYRFRDKQWGTYADNVWYTGDTDGKAGRSEGSIGNPDFSWEETKEFNIGFDATLLKNLSVTFDMFDQKKTGILQSPTGEVPAYTGFKLPVLNTGKVSNHGFEAIIKYSGTISSFQYHVGATAAFSRNKIDYKSEDAQPEAYLYQTGYRIDQWRGLVSDGYYQTSDFDVNGALNAGVIKSAYSNVKPGDLKYKDIHKDGIINDYDKIPIDYTSTPEWTMGFNAGFNFKGFDFDAFFEGVTNRTLTMPAAYTQPFMNNNNITPFSLNAWTPETAATATSPRLTTQANLNNTQGSDFWFRDGSYIKLRSVELGYTIPKVGFFKKMNTVRMYVNGTNLITWDKITALEAENLSMGYPLLKAVSFGLNVVF